MTSHNFSVIPARDPQSGTTSSTKTELCAETAIPSTLLMVRSIHPPIFKLSLKFETVLKFIITRELLLKSRLGFYKYISETLGTWIAELAIATSFITFFIFCLVIVTLTFISLHTTKPYDKCWLCLKTYVLQLKDPKLERKQRYREAYFHQYFH